MKTMADYFATTLLMAKVGSALAAVHYVDVNSTNATPPYANWATAATNIQDAVDAAVAGDEIVVTNGTYATGARTIDGVTVNRVAADKPLKLRSVNGPQFTTIDGGGSARCVYLTNGASLSGFTLTGGNVDDTLLVESLYGGAAYGGTLNNCAIAGNTVYYIYSDLSYHGAYGGGAAFCTLNNCTLAYNYAYSDEPYSLASGGGAYYCTLNNCTLIGNSIYSDPNNAYAYANGGGASYCTLSNCTLTDNRVTGPGGFGSTGGSGGGGTSNCTLHNCISFGNSVEGSCEDCYSPGRLEAGNWLGDPLFVNTNFWANLRLQSNSPCINAGNNAYAPAGPDLDGNPRIAGGTVDIGAYEFQAPVSKISYAWLQQYGLPINAATDTADPDGDAMNNWQEWICGTDPTNALSVLRLLSPAKGASGVNVTWQSVNTRSYFLERSTYLGARSAFLPLATNIPGQTGTTTFTDTNAIGAGPWFYSVGVSAP